MVGGVVPGWDTAPLDLVYVVRPGDDNEELRHSLRSVAANLPHRKVWVVGHCPVWVRNVERVELVPLDDKWENIEQNVTAACSASGITDSFVLMSDDMTVLRPLDSLPAFHLGRTEAFITRVLRIGKDPKSPWVRGLVATLAQMREWGHGDPLCYETHTPLIFDCDRLGGAMERTTFHPSLWGLLYDEAGAGVEGVESVDTKVTGMSGSHLEAVLSHGMPFLSTHDRSFANGAVGDFIRAQFPEPCIYEEVRHGST